MDRGHDKNLKSAWRKLLPSAVSERDFHSFETEQNRDEASVMREVLDLCSDLGLEANADDVEELVDSHCEDLTTEDLQQLQDENQRAERGEIITAGSEGEEEEQQKAITTDELKQTLHMWRTIEVTIDKFHPNKTMACSVINTMNDFIMPFFNHLLRNRKKQATLDRYFKQTPAEKTLSDEPQPGPSAIKRIRREILHSPK